MHDFMAAEDTGQGQGRGLVKGQVSVAGVICGVDKHVKPAQYRYGAGVQTAREGNTGHAAAVIHLAFATKVLKGWPCNSELTGCTAAAGKC
jgi:hypothetical protein